MICTIMYTATDKMEKDLPSLCIHCEHTIRDPIIEVELVEI